jgi:ribosomal protein S18 acetylase RimI-like enzyme
VDVNGITIRKLASISVDDMRRLIRGYQSPARYRAGKVETETHTAITLDLETLETPYLKTWELTGEDIRHYLQVVPEGHSLAAYAGDEMVGLGLAEARQWNRTLWIWEFHVLDSHRRQGIGRGLMDALEQEARRTGMRTMLVEVQNTNVPAIRFYHSVGFQVESIDLSYYTNTDATDFEVAIFMKRKIEV